MMIIYLTIINSLIHSGYFHSAYSSSLLLRSAPDTTRILLPEFHAKAPQAIASEGLDQGPYVATIAEFEPATLRTKGVESTSAPPRPTPLCGAYFRNLTVYSRLQTVA